MIIKTLMAMFGLWLMASNAQANIINGDFSQGFAGWSAVFTSCSICDGSDDEFIELDPLPEAFDDENLRIEGGAVGLVTSFDVFAVNLFQTFTLPEVSKQLNLSLDLEIDLSDDLFDFAFAQLIVNDGSLPTVDLSAGGEFNITPYAGQAVEILFGLTDFDFQSDTLTVDNITVVPAPGMPLLLGIGLLALLGSRKRA